MAHRRTGSSSLSFRFYIFSNLLRSSAFVPCLAVESEADGRLFVEPGGLNDDGVIGQRFSRYELEREAPLTTQSRLDEQLNLVTVGTVNSGYR